MMRIRVLATGRLKEAFWRGAQGEYEKRLSRYCDLEILEVPDERAPERLSDAERLRVRQAEGRRLLSSVGENETLVALAIDGEELSSERFARALQGWMLENRGRLNFAIGGSLGLSQEVLNRADLCLSFGPMTFPHQLFRVMLLEQIYRGFRILAGEPYHK